MCHKSLWNRLQLQFGELQCLVFIDYDLLSAVNPHIWHSVVLYCRVQTGWWSWLKSTKWLCSVKTNSHFLPCRSCSNSVKVTWRVQLQCDAVFMTSSPSSSLRFSLLAVVFRTTLNKITSRRFHQHLRKAPFCSGISFHLFIFTYSPAFAIPWAKRTKQIFESLQCKNAPISSPQVRSRR